MRHRHLPALLVPSLLAVTALAPGSAEAANRTVSDRAGDAAPALDITSVRYTNNDTSVAFTWHLRKVRNTTRLIGTTLDTCDGLCSDYYQYRVARVNGVPKVRVYRGLASGGLKQRNCSGAEVTWSPVRHVIHARVPKRCMVGPAELFMQSWTVRVWTGRPADLTAGRDVARA